MTDPYNSAPPRKDPWRREPVKKDRRKSNPRKRARRTNPAKFDRCVKAVKKIGSAVNPYAVCTAAGTRKTRRVNPRKPGKRAQRKNHKSLLDWAGSMLRRPAMRMPGGRSSHDLAREQIALVRARYSNPRSAPAHKEWMIAGKKGTQTLYYAGNGAFKARAHAKYFSSVADAQAMIWLLKDGYPVLKSWRLAAVTA